MDPIITNPELSPDNGASKHSFTDRAREALDGVSHTAGDLAAKAKGSIGDAAAKVQDTATRASRSSRQLVRDNPIRAMAIGVGAGIVVGLVLARSLFQRGE